MGYLCLHLVLSILLNLDRAQFLHKALLSGYASFSFLWITPSGYRDEERHEGQGGISSFITSPSSSNSVTKIPIESCFGGTSCVQIRVSDDEGVVRVYQAAIDTGSPYLILGTSFTREGTRSRYLQLTPSGYPPTEEIYGSGSGFLDWKKASVNWVRSFGTRLRFGNDKTLLGLMDSALEVEAGGTLLGLVKHPNPPRQKDCYRPTWLEQVRFEDGTEVRSFSISGDYIVLSNKSLMKWQTPQIPLMDLRPLGDFIEHYAFSIKELFLDGLSVTSEDLKGRPIVAVLDTGLTGCLVDQPLWDILTDEFEVDPRKIRLATIRAEDKRHHQTVEFTSGRGFNNLFYVAPIYLDWFYDQLPAPPYVIVLGETFLGQGKLTVDIEDRLVSFEI